MYIWRHKKTGHKYLIIKFGVIEDTVTPCVIYRGIDEDTHWVRPCFQFFDGRFEPVSDLESE